MTEIPLQSKSPNLQPNRKPSSLLNHRPSLFSHSSIENPLHLKTPKSKVFIPSPSNSLESLSVSRQHKTKEGNKEEEEKRKKKGERKRKKNAVKTQIGSGSYCVGCGLLGISFFILITDNCGC